MITKHQAIELAKQAILDRHSEWLGHEIATRRKGWLFKDAGWWDVESSSGSKDGGHLWVRIDAGTGAVLRILGPGIDYQAD